MLKKVLILFTGGTISMKRDEVTRASIPAFNGSEILDMTPGIRKLANIEYIDFGMIPGPHMTPHKMYEISQVITKKIQVENFDGVVVTHGTDSLEETAFLVDLTYPLKKPVIFVGAMRSSSDLGWDGPGNLIDALYTVTNDSAYNRGVLVVMNGQIHSASQVTKTHTNTLNAFESPNFGPVGFVDNNKSYFYHDYTKRQYIKVNRIEDKVDLIKCAAGMDDEWIRFSVNRGAKGIVIEGMGRGNVPPAMMLGIQFAIEKQIPVVLTSRCLMGRVLDSYGYPGAGKELTKMGVIMADNLPGHKARIKLMVALGRVKKVEDVKIVFEKGFYDV
jgi:L-asparaginase